MSDVDQAGAMRVVLFPSAYAPAVGGVEELTARLAAHLHGAGDEVEVWTIRHPPALAGEEIIDGVQVRRFATPLPTSDLRELASFPVRFARALVKLVRATRRARPDVFHVQCFSANGIYAILLGGLCRIPVIVSLQGETVMDDNDVYEKSWVLQHGLRLGLRRAAVVTACSRFTLDDAVRRFGLPTGSGEVIPNGVDLEAPPQLAEVDLPPRYVFAAGRVVRKKGFDLLLEAFARVAEDDADVALVIGGDGRERAPLVARAAELGLTSRVFFPGVLTRSQMARAMAGAEVFVLPSRVEPFGIVVLEALRAGTPAVVSSSGGAGEIARHDVEAFVADPTDAEGLANAIRELLRDPVRGARMVEAGSRRVTAFGWPVVAARYRERYRAVSSR